MINPNATWGDIQNEYDTLPTDSEGLFFGYTEDEIFEQDPDVLVFQEFYDMFTEKRGEELDND